jgi:hypothetical protein
MKFVSITHSERNIRNGPIVSTVISREKRKPVLKGSGFAKYSDDLYAPCITDKPQTDHKDVCVLCKESCRLSVTNMAAVRDERVTWQAQGVIFHGLEATSDNILEL